MKNAMTTTKAAKAEAKELKAKAIADAKATRDAAIAAIANRETHKTAKKDLMLVDPRNIIIEEGFNTRKNYGKMKELKDSIIANGVTTPLKGFKRGDQFVLTDGHRRMAAIQMALAEGKDVPAVPFTTSKKTSDVDRTLEIVISNDGKALTTLELANTFKRLVMQGLTTAEVATRTGKSYAYVNKLLSLTNATPATLALVEEGKVSVWTVIEALKKETPENVESHVNAIITSNADKSSTEVKAETKKQMVEKVTYTKTEVKALLKDQLNNIVAMIINGDSADTISNFNFNF